MQTTNLNKPELLLITGAVMISFSGVYVQIAQVAPIVSAFYRLFFGSICLFFACAVKQEFKNMGTKNNLLAILCGLAFAFDLGAWHFSIKYVGPGLATILGNFQVFGLALAGIFLFKEKVRTNFLISLPLAFIGLLLIIGFDTKGLSSSYYIGVLSGLATAFFYTIFLLLLKKLQSEAKMVSIFYYPMLAAIAGSIFLGSNILFSNNTFIIPDAKSLFALLSLGVLSQFVAWSMIAKSLPQVKTSNVGLILLLQPAFAFVWDVLFFKRQTNALGWFGVFVVLIAIYFGMNERNK